MNWGDQFFLCQGVRRVPSTREDIITDEQRRERKSLAAISIGYSPDAALEQTQFFCPLFNQGFVHILSSHT